MNSDEVVDWRVHLGGRVVSSNLPPRYPGDKGVRTGDEFYMLTAVQHPDYNILSFVIPNAQSLAFNIAVKFAKDAKKLQGALTLEDTTTPIHGPAKMIAPENSPLLFDYFEHCMVAVTFSFQTIETFCNRVIGSQVKGTFQLLRKSKILHLNADELERQSSTEEKLCTILPRLLSVKSPKGTKLWEKFRELKEVRDLTMHFKSYQTQNQIDRETLFFKFFQADALVYPEITLEIIRHYAPDSDNNGWLSHAKKMLK